MTVWRGKFLPVAVYLGWVFALSACASSSIGTLPVTVSPLVTSTVPASIATESSTVLPSPTATLDSVISLANAKQLKLLRKLGPSPITIDGIGGAVPSPEGKTLAVFWDYNPKFELWDIES